MGTERDGAGDPTLGPVAIEIAGRTAILLTRLAEQVGARTPGEIVAQAVGLLSIVLDAKHSGRRIIIRDPGTGQETDLAP